MENRAKSAMERFVANQSNGSRSRGLNAIDKVDER
jgi:hypothetical protein